MYDLDLHLLTARVRYVLHRYTIRPVNSLW